jgi:hypothetical protein
MELPSIEDGLAGTNMFEMLVVAWEPNGVESGFKELDTSFCSGFLPAATSLSPEFFSFSRRPDEVQGENIFGVLVVGWGPICT